MEIAKRRRATEVAVSHDSNSHLNQPSPTHATVATGGDNQIDETSVAELPPLLASPDACKEK